MRLIQCTILSLFTLLFALNSVAQESVPEPVSARFPNIRASLDDGFFVLAEQLARGELRKNLKEDEAKEASMLLIHALWGQKRYSEMLEHLKTYNGDPGYVYWRTRARFELKQYEQALQLLANGGDTLDQSRYAPSAMRLQGHIEQLIGELDLATITFQAFDKRFPAHPEAVENQFDLADVHSRNGRVSEAMVLYEKLAEGSNQADVERARIGLARLFYIQGEEDSLDVARTMFTALATNDQARLVSRIDAFVDLAALEEKAGQSEAAVAAMRGGIALSPDARQRVPLKLTLSRMLLRGGDTAGALVLLEQCRAEAPNAVMAVELQLEKANALLKAKRFEEAEAAFQVYLDVADDPDGLARAWFGKGIALWEMEPGRYAEAAVLLDRAAAELTLPKDKAAALFKAGDAYYKAEKYDEAEKRYAQYVETYPESDAVANALYQQGLSLARANKPVEALAVFRTLEIEYTASSFAELAALRSADVLRVNKQWADVLAKYTQISQTYTNSPDTQALSELQRGLALYRLGQFPESQQVFEQMIKTYPESEHVPQATYLRGYSLAFQGKTKEGVKVCEDFIKKYPDSEWTPEVIFWLAERHFNLGEYDKAEPLFLKIANDYKGHRLAPRALYWAGRCLAAQSNYRKAIERYSEVAKTYPNSEILPQTRFRQGDALSVLGQHARAILAFKDIIINYPGSYLVNGAWGRQGDCLFELGAKDPQRYSEAMDSFQAVLDRPSAPQALKLQVEYKIGECLEKMNQPDKAFSRYMNVVYTFINENVERSPYSIRWFTRAAIAAAKIKEVEKSWVEAVNVYERIVEAHVPAKDQAAQSIERIKQENWLLFQQAGETE